ncbi:MAG: catalase, partial [Hyphomicrobiales bacterium]
SRLGSVNFHQLPINRAKGCPVMNMQRDGHMQMEVPAGRANYEPNTLAKVGEPGGPRESLKTGFRTFAAPVTETKVRIRAETFADHYSQARMFFRSQSEPEQAHLASALVFELSKVTFDHVRAQVLGNLRNVDETLAQRVADGLGLSEAPAKTPAAAEPQDMDLSPALRILGKYPETLEGRTVGILVADGSASATIDAIKDAVIAAGAKPKVIAPKLNVKLDGGPATPIDGQLAGSPSVMFDAIAVVLSDAGVKTLLKDSAAIDYVKDAFGHLKAIAFTSAAKPLLDKAGVEADAGIIELSGKDVKAFLKQAKTRQWDREPNIRLLA